jgi:hypothetical protein
MTVNYEIKSQLARLLATEDLVVENRNVATAQFNIETRVLTLPMWKRASENVYDMLVGHEVGHALYTPNKWDWENRIPRQFVNVVEDARIEKLMKRRYPGLSKSFYKGYSELVETDFFCLDDIDITKMNLADRINLYYKIGNFIDISFSDDEKIFVKMMADTETFADTLIVAEEIYRYCKDAEKSKTTKTELPPQQTDQQGIPNESVKNADDGADEDETEENFMTHEEMLEEADRRESANKEPEVTTDQIFEEGAEEFNGNMDESRDPTYCEIPKVNLEHFIVSNSDVHETINNKWQEGLNPQPSWCPYDEKYKTPNPFDFNYADHEFDKFKKSAQKEINYMVKEFECKKSADSYSRAATARTGVLDCSKLHTYKYNEDLFKKVTVLPDGKNHGLIFILDWSGSMGDCIVPTVKQLLNIVWFCNKVNIPFDVYAFTNNWAREGRYGFDWEDLSTQENEQGMFNITGGHFSLMNILSSDVKKSEVEKQILNLWRVAFSFKHWVAYSIPSEVGLSGTPLHESLVCLHQIIPQFKSKYGVQKTHCVILTDGEANSLPVFKRIVDYKGEDRLGVCSVSCGSFLRNRKTGHTYKFDQAYYKFTDVLLKDLRQTFPETNFIGIRLCNGREMGDIIRRYERMSDDQMKKVKKVKSYAVKESGYTSLFTMLSSSLENTNELDVDEGATKAKIKSAFMKNLKAKALNKKVLSQFMDLVC